MKRLNFAILLLASFILAAPKVEFAQQPPAPSIFGLVVSNSRGPIQGCTVSLVHQVLGRGAPVFSGPGGNYGFYNVPPRPEPYYIEAYWGQQLLFRSMLYYKGGSVRFDIRLP